MKHAPAQFLGLDGEAPALFVVQAQSLASELFAQDTVFFLEVVDDILLPLAQAAGQRNQQ